MITGQELRLLEGKPALGLEVRALRTGPMPTRVVPDTRHMAVGTRLDMTTQRGRPALHNGACGFADVRGYGMGVFVSGKGVLEDRLQRDERHRGLRTRGHRLSLGGLLQYHANYPRCKRLVQPPIIDRASGVSCLFSRAHLCHIMGMLLVIDIFCRVVG